MRYDIEGLKAAYDMNPYMGLDDFLYFWKHTEEHHGIVSKACLSQWYPCRFIVDGMVYSSAEQYMMAEKCRLFGDEDSRRRILAEDDPETVKRIGRVCRGFDDNTWKKHRREIVKRGNIAKFRQNVQLFTFLMSTGRKVLAEASPYDTIWGIGMDEVTAKELWPHKWKGENRLGFILMEVRDILREEYEREFARGGL